MTAFDAEDEYAIYHHIRVKRSDLSVDAIYRDGAWIEKKNMTQEDLLKAHDEVRRHSFDIVGEENKGA